MRMLFIFLGFLALAFFCVRRHLDSRAAHSPTGSGESGSPSSRGRAVVLVEQCVGCGTCVDACPETGAIKVLERIAVVDRSICVGHGSGSGDA